jgi:ABC-type multidrug transport system permease subunit
MGALYASVLFLGVSNASSVQPVFATERAVSYRERGAGMYSPTAWVLALCAIEIPYVFVQTIVYSLITYAMINFEWTAGAYAALSGRASLVSLQGQVTSTK